MKEFNTKLKESNATHNYNLRDELKATFEITVMKRIGKSHWNINGLTNVFREVKAATLRNVSLHFHLVALPLFHSIFAIQLTICGFSLIPGKKVVTIHLKVFDKA